MAVDPNRWTLKTTDAFNAAVGVAREANHPEVTADHLLAAMLAQDGTVVLPVLQKVGVTPAVVRNRVEDALAKLPKAYGGNDPTLSRDARDIVEAADRERTELGDDYVSIEHLLLAMADREPLLPVTRAMLSVATEVARKLDRHLAVT